ncbi:MAG: TolC family protein, partial [Pseudomonadota bacterium]
MLPTEMVRPLLLEYPNVGAARAGLEGARQEADLLDGSPYEWTARLSSQRRTLQEGPAYQEWNAGIERPLRLPGKASADRNIGKATMKEAEARYGEALHEAAQNLLSLWLDWLAAERGRELASANRESAQGNLSAVEKRLRAGDASKLDVSLAQAELAEQQRVDNDAKTQATVAWGRLHARFPGLGQEWKAWPTSVPLKQNAAFWRERILAESDELKTAQAQLQKAQAEAERARADKLPDPTVGIYTASEVGGRERITGLSVSMPIPGGQRSQRAARALQLVEVMRQ